MWMMLLGLVPLSAVISLDGLVRRRAVRRPIARMSAFGSEVAGFLSNSQVAVLPLFLMMGSLPAVSGIAEDMYVLAHAA